MCQRFGYDKIAATTSGTEAADAACKIARKWGIKIKGIPPEECLVLGVGQSYHGLVSSVWPLMDPTPGRAEYGLPTTTCMNVNPTTGASLDYLNLEAMRQCLEDHHHRIAAVIMEPLHGSSRETKQEVNYARGVYDLCKKFNILFIADEVRQGAGKTGKFCSHEHLGTDCKPDIVTMG
jgi:ornithine--oxo-acid transaminase